MKNPADILLVQTQSAYEWINKLVTDIPFQQWEKVPDTLATHVSWQTGHLIVSLYYHSILCITGHQMEILQSMPLKRYSELFTKAEPMLCCGQINPSDLLQHLQQMQLASLKTIGQLTEKDLFAALPPAATPHPIARYKWEALDWNIKHTMWHCGQLAILKRVVDKRFDFDLQF